MSEEVTMHYISEDKYWELHKNGSATLRQTKPEGYWQPILGQVVPNGEVYRVNIRSKTVMQDENVWKPKTFATLKAGMEYVELQVVIKRLEQA